MRQRPAQPPPKASGGSKAGGGTLEEAFSLEGSRGPIFSRAANAKASNSTRSSGSGGITRSNDSSSNKEHYPLGEQSTTSKVHGVRSEGSVVRADRPNAGGGDAGIKSRGRTCGEAWGSSAVVGAKSAECTQNKGGSSRGKNVMSSDCWAWAGGGGYEARENAMLSAYGLQLDKETPTWPSERPGKGAARHGRWQCIRGVGHRQNRGAGTECSREKGGVGKDDERRKESDAGERGSRRCVDRPSTRTASGQGRGFRPAKSQKHPPSISLCKLSSTSRRSGRHSSAGGKKGRTNNNTTHARVIGESETREETPLVVMTTEALPPKSFDGSESNESRADLNVTACDSTSNNVQSTQKPLVGCQAYGDHTAIAVPAVSASVQVAKMFTMDGRGGTAAPPYRPQRLTLGTPATSASYSVVFPDLIATSGTGDGIMVALGSDRSRDQGPKRSDASSGDGINGVLSGPPVRSQHSPWNTSSRDHSHYNHRARSFFSGKGGSKTSRSAAAAAAGTACSFDEAPERFLSPKILPKGTGVIEPSINRERTKVVTAPGAAAEDAGEQIIVGEFDFDPLNRLLHGSTTTMTPDSDVVEHFNQALRPASRRGTRRRGREGDAPPPEPALCLFSGSRGDRSGRAGESMVCAQPS